MPTIDESITIRAPQETVFAAATDPRRAGEWSPRIVQVSNVTPGPPRVGTRWQQTASMAGQTAIMTCRIVGLAPPTEGIVEISGGDQQGRLVTRCTAVPGGTRVDQSLEFAVPDGFKGKMMAAVAVPMLQREMSQALARLRNSLEGGAGGGDGSRTA